MQTQKSKALPPGPNRLEMLKILYQVKTSGTGPAFLKLREDYGDIIFLPIFNRYVIFDPKDIKHVLKDNKKNYLKSNTIEFVKTFLGEGLATSDGVLWKKQRRNVGKEFHRASIKHYTPAMIKLAKKYVNKWGEGNSQIDVSQELLDLTFDIACEVFFGIESGVQTEKLRDAFVICADMAVTRGRALIPLPNFMMKNKLAEEQKALETMDNIVFDIIKLHEQGGGSDDNVLTKLLQYTDEETGEKMSQKQLRDELITVLVGGFETTCNALIWTIYLLASNPDSYKKVEAELDKQLDDDNVGMDQLMGLPYLTQCFQESMRLYPPFPVLSRRNLESDSIAGYGIAPDQHIYIMPYVTHRDPEYFENPGAFNPDRFSRDQKINESGIAYLPFGEGQRKCIGENFAMIEGITLLAIILRNFHFELVPGFEPEPKFSITLYSANGMPMKISKR
ncbi:MAG: cytochrome P450 [Pseudomonadales bacterium]|nr:cytochrome P450 [Pseudomonadales bacterium]